MEGMPRCSHCGDVIGVYEPIVVLVDGGPHRTSRARLGGDARPAAECYHDDCYARLLGERPLRD